MNNYVIEYNSDSDATVEMNIYDQKIKSVVSNINQTAENYDCIYEEQLRLMDSDNEVNQFEQNVIKENNKNEKTINQKKKLKQVTVRMIL